MKTIVRKGVFLVLIYAMAVISTLFITDRVEELDSVDRPNTNQSLSIKLSR